MGRGPRTEAQLIVTLCELLNLTPLQAQRELATNPLIYRVLHTKLYESAHKAWMQWEGMSSEQRKGQAEPSGMMVGEVRRNIRRVREEMAAEFNSALDAEGRL